jgi:hypothetical protein
MDEMVRRMVEEFDLTEIATLMMESVPATITEMEAKILGEMPDDGYTDEEYEAFNKAFWQAICKANTEQ